MKFNTYVLSLIDEKNRRENIEQQLRKKNITFEFFDAIDLRTKEKDHILSIYSPELAKKFLHRELTINEVACAKSHIEIYKNIISSDHYWTLILEDDADLTRLNIDDLNKIINAQDINVIDAIILGYSKLSKKEEYSFYIKEPIKTKISFDNFKLGFPWKNWTCGTVGYLINKSGAEKIIKNFNKNGCHIKTVADDWNYFHTICGLNIAHIRPLIIFENFELFESTIESDRAKLTLPKRTYSFLNFARYIRGFFRRIIMLVK